MSHECVCLCGRSLGVCVSVCMFRWPLTLQCPDTPDEYLQDTGGEKRGAALCQAFGQAAALYIYKCVCDSVCLRECRGRRAGRQSALSKQVTPEGCIALSSEPRRDSANYTRVATVCVCCKHYVELCHRTGCVISLAQGGVRTGVCAHACTSVYVCVTECWLGGRCHRSLPD